MSEDAQRTNQFDISRQRAVQKGQAEGRPGVDRAIKTQLSASGVTCEAPECTNPGGAFTSDCGGQIYQFCSEACRARFESTPPS